MPLNDFGCRHHHVTEAIRPLGVESINCDTCGDIAERLPARGVAVVGPTTNIRGMYRDFVEASAEIEHSATKYEHDNGQAAPNLGLWGAAKARANAMTLAGEAPPREI